jgi:hypothetical protein
MFLELRSCRARQRHVSPLQVIACSRAEHQQNLSNLKGSACSRHLCANIANGVHASVAPSPDSPCCAASTKGTARMCSIVHRGRTRQYASCIAAFCDCAACTASAFNRVRRVRAMHLAVLNCLCQAGLGASTPGADAASNILQRIDANSHSPLHSMSQLSDVDDAATLCEDRSKMRREKRSRDSKQLELKRRSLSLVIACPGQLLQRRGCGCTGRAVRMACACQTRDDTGRTLDAIACGPLKHCWQ